MNVTVDNVRKFQKGAMQGFFDLVLEGLLRINGCTFFEKSGSWWIALPSKPYEAKDGTTKYMQIVEFDAARKDNLQKLVVPQLREIIEAGPLPEPAKPVSKDYPKSEKKPNPRQELLDEARDWVVPDDSLDDDTPF